MDSGVPDEAARWRELNRANWDSRVPVHLGSSFYDIEGFASGADTLRPYEDADVGPVRGKRLVHLQCHIGLDTLSWAKRGATVTGVDFSPPAIDAASSLARRLDLPASFVVSDVYDAADALSGQRFDIVYTGIGALVWLPDLTRWAQVVASLLAPGGFVYLTEGHPFSGILDDATGSCVARDYFDSTGEVTDYPYSYTDGPPLAETVSVQFQHGMGEIITAVAQAGMRIEFVHEYPFESFRRFESLTIGADGLYWLPAGQPRVPMMYALRAAKPESL